MLTRMLIALTGCMLALSSSSLPQNAHGRVWLSQGGTVVIAGGATIQIRCPAGDQAAAWASATASDNGTYQTAGPAGGRCDVRVLFRDVTSTTIVVYFTSRTRVNLELLPSQEGWLLRRR